MTSHTDPAGRSILEQQVRRACAELERRLRAGDACRAEEFFGTCPDLSADVEAALDLIYAEYLTRLELGQQAVTDDLCARFPQWGHTLRQQFALHEWLRDSDVNDPYGGTQVPTDPVPSEASLNFATADWPRHYEILEEIGRGGMGVVYKARQLALGRLVALKMILAGAHAAPEDLARFHAEAEAVARLQHPNIVQIYEIGEQDGRPFLALEYVDGGSLDDYLAASPQPARTAAELVETLARAIQVAHQHSIVHRDLKPANILLESGVSCLVSGDETSCTTPNSKLQTPNTLHPKITDFGLAKRLNVEAGPTLSDVVIGTPSYMAPEQAAGESSRIGPATDVYALGVILYEMLTGHPPFDGATPLDTIILVIEEEPVPPRRLQPTVPRDLETICLKCLEKDPKRRYASALALAEDLRCFQNGEPIQARPVTPWERAVKWARRRPAIASLIGLTVLVTTLGLIGVLWQWREAVVARADAEDSARHESAARLKATEALAASQRNLYFSRIALADREWSANHPGQVRALLAECPMDLRHFEWGYLQQQCDSDLRTLTGHTATVRSVAYDPDGKQLVSVSEDGTVRLWDADSGKELHTLRGHRGAVWSVAYSPDRQHVASGGVDGSVIIWDAVSGKAKHTLRGHNNVVRTIAYRRDGQELATAGGDGKVILWDPRTGQEIRTLRQFPCTVFCLAYSSSGGLLAIALEDETVRIWDPAGQEVHSFKAHAAWVTGVVFGRDANQVITCGTDEMVRVWTLSPRPIPVTLRGHADGVYAVGFDAQRQRVVSAGRDQTLRVWHTVEGSADIYRGHTRPVNFLSIHLDGQRIATASQDGTIKIWNTAVRQEAVSLAGHTTYIGGLAFHPEGHQLASASRDGTVRVWDVRSHKEVQVLGTPVAETRDPLALSGTAVPTGSVAYRPDGRQLAAVNTDASVRLWDVATGQLEKCLKGHDGIVRAVAYSPDGRCLATAGSDRTVRLWDVANGQELRALKGHTGIISDVAYHPDGRLVASAGLDGTIRLWDVQSGDAVRVLTGHDKVHAVAFRPDGAILASAGEDATVRLWEAATGRHVRSLLGHIDPVLGLAFSADGERIATASVDRTVRLWDGGTGQELLTLRGHVRYVQAVAFSPDDRRLASAGRDNLVRLWEATALPARDGKRK